MAGYRQPEEVHILVHHINGILGNNGNTVEFIPAATGQFGTLKDLSEDLGKYDRVVNLGCNPIYDGGVDIDSKAIVDKTEFRLTYFKKDESYSSMGKPSTRSCINAPLAHYLESWGDARTNDGTIVSIQPLIAPLFDAMSELEVLSIYASANPDTYRSAYDIVKDTFSGDSWEHYLHQGYQEGSESAPFTDLELSREIPSISYSTIPSKSVEVVFTRDYSVDDGRFANNGWCQEVPDPITKITWDNVCLLYTSDAADE